MPKKGRAPLDPIQSIAASGFIGYVAEEEESHQADEPGVIWVDIENIKDNPYQHAEVIDSDEFQTLVESIKADGFLGALNVSPLAEEGKYYLNGGGHQRRDAARAAGLTKLPVFVTDEPTDRSVLALRVARENTTRVNTSIINLGHLYQQMIDEFGLTQEEIAQRIGKDRNHVKFALMAVRSPDDIQDMLRKRPDSLRAMTYFRRLDKAEDRQPIMERFIAGELSTEGVRREVEDVLERQHQKISGNVISSASSASMPSLDVEQTSNIGVVSFTESVKVDQFSDLYNGVGPSQEEETEQTERMPEMVAHPSHTPTIAEIGDERVRQVQTILQMLREYRHLCGPLSGPLSEEELRTLRRIGTIAQQLIDTN